MTIMHPILMAEIEAFLAETKMGESYFGKCAAGNSELVSRLRAGKRVWPDTETKVRSFILARRQADKKRVMNEKLTVQGSAPSKRGAA